MSCTCCRPSKFVHSLTDSASCQNPRDGELRSCGWAANEFPRATSTLWFPKETRSLELLLPEAWAVFGFDDSFAATQTSLPVIVEKSTVDRPIESDSEQFALAPASSAMARVSREHDNPTHLRDTPAFRDSRSHTRRLAIPLLGQWSALKMNVRPNAREIRGIHAL